MASTSALTEKFPPVLWMALHGPQLSLESWAQTMAPSLSSLSMPLALTDAHRLLAVNVPAQVLGLHPGLQRATALALAPQVLLGPVDEARDAQALMRLAHVALAFTPMVCLSSHPVHTVLLEVGSCLRYFGGALRLRQRLRQSLSATGTLRAHQLHWASAPTAQGAASLAWWAAHTGQSQVIATSGANDLTDERAGARGLVLDADWHCTDHQALLRLLEAAPLTILAAATEHGRAWSGMGLRTLGALCRLPRAGLARRFGVALLDEMDLITGRRPDARIPLCWPDTFRGQLELWTRADTADQLGPAAIVLLEQLVAWVRARRGRVRCFTLVCVHEAARCSTGAGSTDQGRAPPSPPSPPTRPWQIEPHQTGRREARSTLSVALSQPSSDLVHLRSLLREHLARWALPAPAHGLLLDCADWVPGDAPPHSLFPDPSHELEGLTSLIDRLQARLGVGQVRRLRMVADHRPECAQRSEPVQGVLSRNRPTVVPPLGIGLRPIWLLNPPQPLTERHHQPWLDHQPLQLLSGPERMEAGWWDQALAERDYFIAQQPSGALVWVYRLRHPPADEPTEGRAVRASWFLQGRFG